MIHFYLEKFDRGAWNVAYFDSRYPDVCQGLQNPASIWYPMTSKFKKKNCPFPAGHVETFDNVILYEVPDELPNTLAGKYRFSSLDILEWVEEGNRMFRRRHGSLRVVKELC